jgi:hypothetical protein
MPLPDFYECMICDEIEPLAEHRADLLAGMLASLFANIHRSKDTRPYRPEDFMPRFGKPQRQIQTADEQMEMILVLQQLTNRKANA